MLEPRGEALVGNASDANQVRNAGKAKKRQQQRLAAAFAAVVRTSDGRLVLGELLARAGVFQTPFDSDALVMAFKAGAQNFGLKLMHDIDGVGPTALVDVVAHHREEMRHA